MVKLQIGKPEIRRIEDAKACKSFRIVVPVELMKKLQWSSGDFVRFQVRNKKMVMEKV